MEPRTEILYVSPYCPAPARHGGQTLISRRLKLLSSFAAVDLVCPPPGPGDDAAAAAGELKRYCRDVIFSEPRATLGEQRPWLWHVRGSFNPLTGAGLQARKDGITEAVTRALESRSYGLSIIDHVYTAALLREHGVLPSALPVILAEHNVEHVVASHMGDDARVSRLRRRLWKMQARSFQKMEKDLYPRVDAVLHISPADAACMRTQCPDADIHVVPPHLDPPALRKTDYAGTRVVTFFGTTGYFPNREGLLWCCRSIWPLVLREAPDARLRIIGAVDGELASLLGKTRQVEMAGAVSHEEADRLVMSSDVVVSPIRFGSGIKIKNLVAMGMAMPIVATSASAAGLAVERDADMALADEPEIFAAKVVALLGDEEPRRTMGGRARACFDREYSGAKPLNLLRELVHQTSAKRETHE